MDGKIWVYVRWMRDLPGMIYSASTDFWDEYFMDEDPLTIRRIEAREVVR